MIKNRIFLATVLIGFSTAAMALNWEDLWLNPDQQGFKALTENNWQLAAKDFNSPAWKGVAYYRLKDYNKALASFSKGTDATSFYNSGNTLALLGRYQDAIKAYDKTLALNPSFEDARFNRNLLQNAANSTPPSSTATSQIAPPFKRHFNDKRNSAQSGTETPANNAATTPTNTPQNTTQPSAQAQNSLKPNSTQQTATGSTVTSYQDQQQQQALQNVNDDPDGLLQKKLARDYAATQQQGN